MRYLAGSLEDLAAENAQMGMSLRDQFAMAALSGSLASQSIQSGYYVNYPALAKQCYVIADAFLEARK